MMNCPYPGLRPFTVEESLFFKGRDLHIRQIISKLEANKFLMITGASGDGKSSLIYAGVLPSAKAGFFRAKHNRWLFADFRPERNPLKNLAQALSTALNLHFEYTQKELSYGFSSLVDLYKSSAFYSEESNPKAANLFILTDQFDEFFTNTENFSQGEVSENAYTTVNLLLQTARIALRDDLPIYIACTLRSDFISQCIAFGGLPEAIGFSQFFVPRLNRKELQQVIEEPAILAGGSVSQRLKETLINELNQGFDQLPILQHTLKQLWKYANNGAEELDLVHLAKIGGISNKTLVVKEQILFKEWFKRLNSLQKGMLNSPSASNVLNAHANYLYQTAHDYVRVNKNISHQQTQWIIKVAFQCLTKINYGRTVRNRLTLRQITDIINQPSIDSATVCEVLTVFRQQDHTFLYPFIDENNPATYFLSPDTELDLTHESLTRNWKFLVQWNEEEANNLEEFNELKIQLQRWLEYRKSKDFLLVAGNLAHFEEVYEDALINSYWIAKYDNSALSYEEKVENAKVITKNCIQFLEASRKYVVSNERSKYHRRNFLIGAAMVVILVLSGLAYWALNEKRYAEKQRQYAIGSELKAREQNQIACSREKEANLQRKIAEDEKENALMSRRRAIFEKERADYASIVAKMERDNAQEAQRNAEVLRDEAVKSRNEANTQKNNAEFARQKALFNLYIFNAKEFANQSLHLQVNKGDFQASKLKVLLALTAYRLFEEAKKRAVKLKEKVGYEAELIEALQMAILEYETPVLERKSVWAMAMHDNFMAYSPENGKFRVAELVTKGANFMPQLLEHKSISLNTNEFVYSVLNINNEFVFGTSTGKVHSIDATFNEKTLYQHTQNVMALAFDAQKKQVISSSVDNSVLVWDFEKNQKIKTLNFSSKMQSVAVVQPNILVGIDQNNKMILHHLSHFASEIYDVQTETYFFSTMAYNQGLDWLVAGTKDGRILRIKVDKEKLIKNTFRLLPKSHDGSVSAIAFSPDRKWLATASMDGTILLWNLETVNEVGLEKLVPIFIKEKQDKIYALTFDKNSNFLFYATNQAIKTIPLNTKKIVQHLNFHLDKEELSKEQWNYYKKGDIEKP